MNAQEEAGRPADSVCEPPKTGKENNDENDPVLEKAVLDLCKAGKKIEELIEYYI
jgi:hypothetical protein